MTEDPIKRRADGLSKGDRILPAYLPAVGDEPAEVLFVKPYTYVHEAWIFVVFEMPTGLIEATHYKADGGVEIYPAADPTGLTYSRADDGETTQPIAGRFPPHFGAVVSEGGHTAVEVAGGLIEIDPPEGFVGSMLTVDDIPCESRGLGHLPHDGHVYECCGKVGRISRHKPSCPIFGAGPASAV